MGVKLKKDGSIPSTCLSTPKNIIFQSFFTSYIFDPNVVFPLVCFWFLVSFSHTKENHTIFMIKCHGENL